MGSNDSKGRVWGAGAAGGLPALFLIVDAVGKLLKLPPVVEGTLKYGYPEAVIVPLGIVLMACTVLYILPRTRVWGAILLTRYLGGAVNTHVRAGDGLFNRRLPGDPRDSAVGRDVATRRTVAQPRFPAPRLATGAYASQLP